MTMKEMKMGRVRRATSEQINVFHSINSCTYASLWPSLSSNAVSRPRHLSALYGVVSWILWESNLQTSQLKMSSPANPCGCNPRCMTPSGTVCLEHPQNFTSPLSSPMKFQTPFNALLHQHPHHLRAQNLGAKPLFLQQLQRPNRRPRVAQILDVFRPRPVLQIFQVGDEIWSLKQFERGEVVEVERGGKHGDEFEFELEARVAGVEWLGWIGFVRRRRCGLMSGCWARCVVVVHGCI